jgi:hypothetical protein
VLRVQNVLERTNEPLFLHAEHGLDTGESERHRDGDTTPERNDSPVPTPPDLMALDDRDDEELRTATKRRPKVPTPEALASRGGTWKLALMVLLAVLIAAVIGLVAGYRTGPR